jgi:hypothetical protein
LADPLAFQKSVKTPIKKKSNWRLFPQLPSHEKAADKICKVWSLGHSSRVWARIAWCKGLTSKRAIQVTPERTLASVGVMAVAYNINITVINLHNSLGRLRNDRFNSETAVRLFRSEAVLARSLDAFRLSAPLSYSTIQRFTGKSRALKGFTSLVFPHGGRELRQRKLDLSRK